MAALSDNNLALGELEPLTSALLAVLLALVCARISREETGFFQAGTKFGIELHKRASDAETRCACLTNIPASVGEDQNIELLRGLGRQQGLANHRARGFGCEVGVHRPTVYRDRALAGAQKHSGNGTFPSAGAKMLYQSCH
jgi:hypothetical protein